MMNSDNGSDFLMSFFEKAAYGMDVSKKMTIEEAIEIMTVGSDMNKEVEKLSMSQNLGERGKGFAQKIIAQAIVVSYAQKKLMEEKEAEP